MKNTWPAKALGGRKAYDEIVHSWLKDEWHFANYDHIRKSTSADLIDNPDFSNENDNSTRLELLRSVRQPMIDPIPPNTKWYTIDYRKEDFDRTFIVPSADWLPLTNNSYRLLEAVKNISTNLDHSNRIREIKKAISLGNVSSNLILVASSPDSLFTVIEGNHRAVAFTSKALENNEKDPVIDKIFLGISSLMKNYIWHIESRIKNEN